MPRLCHKFSHVNFKFNAYKKSWNQYESLQILLVSISILQLSQEINPLTCNCIHYILEQINAQMKLSNMSMKSAYTDDESTLLISLRSFYQIPLSTALVSSDCPALQRANTDSQLQETNMRDVMF